MADPVFLFYVYFKFFSIFCDIALLLCGQIKYFQKRKPVIMSNGCLWRQAVVDRRMQATEMCTPCHHHYATMQLCTPPPPPPLVALCNYALSALHPTQPPLCNYATMNSIPPPLCIQYAIRPPTYNYEPTMIYTKTMLWAMPPLSTMQRNHARLHPQSSIYLAFCPPPLCSMRSPSRLVQ